VADIQSGGLDKVVLTRRVSVCAAQPVDPARVMAILAQRHPRGTLFGLEMPEGGVFMGASPELLAGLHHGEAYCDALAGTAWGPGGARPLLNDVKNGREHRLVVQSIAEALRPVCSRLEVPAAPVALHLGNLHHLWSGLRGRVKPGIGLLDLLERLHPTPAVGGYPRQAALDWLARHKERRGSWYTGAIGWMDMAGEGEFAVALRCAQVHENRAELYAGAGIVAGSDPQRELAETEAKLAPMLDALGGGGHA
jgi:menaquinone-specific isochorismate synthase